MHIAAAMEIIKTRAPRIRPLHAQDGGRLIEMMKEAIECEWASPRLLGGGPRRRIAPVRNGMPSICRRRGSAIG